MYPYIFACLFAFRVCLASYREQYRVPETVTDKWESYVFDNKEYLIQNLPVSWEDANILCAGQYNGSLAVLDSKAKADFLAEALSETQHELQCVWVGARRESAADPAGYRWARRLELRRTALDVLSSETDAQAGNKYPLWLNRTLVPVSAGGADCVALERVQHDKPVFLDLPCEIHRPFVCEREAQRQTAVSELKSVRCRSGVYRIYAGMLRWQEAAAYCLLHNMRLANLSSLKCLKKVGVAMLKSRPSVESAWVGARGSLGKWSWTDTGDSLFTGDASDDWPPMRDRTFVKQSGCLEVDRHSAHSPVFMEARCDRKLHFICYDGPHLKQPIVPPSDDNYYYILVRQRLYWQHAFENCRKMNGTLASVDNNEMLTQLLLVMGESKDEPVYHIWLSGRLNMSKDVSTDAVTYGWYNPATGKQIPDQASYTTATPDLYIPPWFDEEFTMDSPCLNLDRHEHLHALVYGLPCDTPQYSVCLVDKFKAEDARKSQ